MPRPQVLTQQLRDTVDGEVERCVAHAPCPQLDGCIAGVLERGVAAYGSSVGCEMPAPPPIDTLALFATPQCLTVALFCPDLAASLAGGR